MSIKNPITAFVTYCATSGTGLYTLNGARIQVSQLPDNFNNSTSAIVVTLSSGGPDPYTKTLNSALLSCRCYGGSDLMLASHALADALIDRCHGVFNATAGSDRIVRMIAIQKMDAVDPDTGWPYCVVLIDLTVA